MALDFTSANGHLFDAIGAIGGALNSHLGSLGTAAPSPSSAWGASGPAIKCLQDAVDDVATQLAANADIQPLVDGLYTTRTTQRQVGISYANALQRLAEAVLIAVVDADVLLTNRSKGPALVNLIAQMTAQSYKVTAPTVSIGAITAARADTGGANTGDGKCVATVLGPDGLAMVSAFDEDIDVVCTSDSQLGGAASREGFSFAGDAAVGNPLDYNWPAGSGMGGNLTATDALNTSVNKVSNGELEDWTSNTPDDFTLAVGAAGTDLFKETSVVYYTQGATPAAAKFIGTATPTLTQLRQDVTLRPNTVYAVGFWARRSASGTGVFQADLHDGSAVVQDDAGTNNAYARNVSTQITTSYVFYSSVFVTPRVLPSTLRFRLSLTTTLPNGESLYVDRVTLAEMTSAYAGGPYLTVFSGNTPFIKNDAFSVRVNNDHAGAFIKLFERLFGLRQLGLRLRTTGSNSISDALVA